MRRHALRLLLTLVALGCGASAPTPEHGPAAEAWSYTFAVDETLSRLEAEVCFLGEPPSELRPIDAAGRRYLRSATGPVGPDEASLLSEDRRGIVTEGLPRDACVRYVVDLEAAARQRGGIQGAYRIGSDLVASTAVWLWAPRHRDPNAQVSASFELPEDVRVSPLWARRAGRYWLDERAFELTAYAAFGRFETRTVAIPGACMHVSLLGGERFEMGPGALTRSLEGSAVAASMIHGRFPVRELGVLAVPTPLSTSSPFGIVGRGTMPTVAILIGERAEEERLMRAWVPVHEFSHLATPYIDREDAWLSEGVATYYQEVLRARGSLQSPEEAWTHLDDGFRRGDRAGTGRSLARESRDMRHTAAFRRVYWAGAAIALAADVRMRVESGGRLTLDDAIAELGRRRGGEPDGVRAREAIAILDEASDGAFGRVARDALGSSDFPDLEGTYRHLGLRRTAWGGVELVDDPEAEALRNAVMRAPDDLAHLPRCRPVR